jgi:hypothetical protein
MGEREMRLLVVVDVACVPSGCSARQAEYHTGTVAPLSAAADQTSITM